jgi:tetratricopeptide (TPR) repeat protein
LASLPDRPEFRRTLASSLSNLADFLHNRGRTDDAVQTARQVVEVWKRLADDFGTNPNYQNALGVSLQDLAILLNEQGQMAEARRLLEQAIQCQQAALRLKGDRDDYRRALGDHYGYLAEACLRLGDTAAATRAVLELRRILSQDSYRAAHLLARCTAAVEKNSDLPEDKRKELAETYGGQAVELLREAAQKGSHNLSAIEQNTDLDVLRDRSDYRSLVADIKAKERSGSK